MKVGVVVLVSLSLALAACGGDDDATSTPTATAPAPAPSGTDVSDPTLPEEVSDTFVEVCASGGAMSRSQCQCIYDIIEKNDDIDKLIEYGLREGSDPTKLPKSINEAIVTCST